MGSEWAETTLGELCERQGGSIQTGPFGSQLHASDYQDAGTPVVMPVNLVDGRVSEAGIARVGEAHVSRLMRHKLLPGDIVFSRRGDVTRFALITERESGWLCGTGCLKVSFGEQEVATAEFVAAVLSLPESKEWLVQHAVGATMPNLNTSILSALPVRLPGLATQRSATSLLTTLTSRIESLRQTNATLEAIAQALFKSWFVDFDPVRAKAEGREPEGMDPATAALFPSEIGGSDLHPVPKDWRLGTSDELFEIVGGGTPKTSVDDYWSGDIPWFSVVDAPARGQVFTLDTTKKITALGLKNCSAKLLPPMTTIISARGTVGKVTMTGVPMAMNQSCYALRPKAEGGEAFVYFSTLRFVEQLQQIAHGAVFDTITHESFKRIMASIPSKQTIVAFGLMVNPLLERIRINGIQAANLADLRDTLLPRLISGRLRLSEAEAEAEAEAAVKAWSE